MADHKKKTEETQQVRPLSHWEKLKMLGNSAMVKDISTGKTYPIGDLQPLHIENTNLAPEEAGVISTSQAWQYPSEEMMAQMHKILGCTKPHKPHPRAGEQDLERRMYRDIVYIKFLRHDPKPVDNRNEYW